jgi:uncharacterized protein with PQ loop repeat
MEFEHFMNIASTLYFVCYIPELYANYKNKNANIWNIPEKIIILVATGFAFSYSILSKNNALIINYGPVLILDFIALMMRVYYACKNNLEVNKKIQIVDENIEIPNVVTTLN